MPAAKGFNMIYYVEDDDNIRDLTVYALRKQGIEAEGFSCDGEFKAAVARRVPDAVLLDIMLPDTDGLAIMRRLRADRLTATVPIMMLTAKDTELDKVMALDGGADDYLTKPFSLMELASRWPALPARQPQPLPRTAASRRHGQTGKRCAQRGRHCALAQPS